MSRRFARWMLSRTVAVQRALGAVYVAVGTYGAAVLAFVGAEAAQLKGFVEIAVVTAGTFGIVVLLVLIGLLLTEAVDVERRAAETHAQVGSVEQAVLAEARAFSDDVVLDNVSRLGGLADRTRDRVQYRAPADPRAVLQQIVAAAYSMLERTYGRGETLGESIEFEVTYMTKSYVDGGLTIAVWANRYGRRPKSMQKRAGNPKQFETTVAMVVYRDSDHSPQIVEDTSDAKWASHYRQYEGQRNSIRSAIIWPVLSSSYDLLGTLVMHCDRPRFFAEDRHKFWARVCETYCIRLAEAKLMLDETLSYENGTAVPPSGWHDPPF